MSESEPVVLTAWQAKAVDVVAGMALAREIRFGGATALSAVHLQHRRSVDLDFFLPREVTEADAVAMAHALSSIAERLEVQELGPRWAITLLENGQESGHVDLTVRPFDPIDRPVKWRGLLVDSFTDMAVDKTQALLSRGRDRDFVDFLYLVTEGPERDVDRLLSLVRAKFDVGFNRYALARRLLQVEHVPELPEMIRPLTLAELQQRLTEIAKDILRGTAS